MEAICSTADHVIRLCMCSGTNGARPRFQNRGKLSLAEAPDLRALLAVMGVERAARSEGVRMKCRRRPR
jgi:hypothetical protein